MLTHLSISNIVLIDEAEIAFEQGLCVLTGETGAGKSIILDALGLIMGSRGDNNLIRSGADKAKVSAVFDVAGHTGITKEMEELGLEVEDILIIRRLLDKDGKGKCFINDQPVSVAALKALAIHLIEIHGQHDQRGLFDPAIHRKVVDEFGSHAAQLKKVESAYTDWKKTKDALAEALEQIEQAKREEEYLRHIVADLGSLNPKVGEEVELDDKRTTMMQSEKLFDVLNDAMQELQAGGGVASALMGVQRTLTRSPLTSGPEFEEVINWLDQASDMASKAEQELEAIGREAEFDPAALERMEERLFAIRDAVRKYKCPADELPDVLRQAKDALDKLDKNESHMKMLVTQEKEAKKAYGEQAEILSDMRQKTAKKLETALLKELKPLKMEHTHFEVTFEKLEEAQWAKHGFDQLMFQVATNVAKGEKPNVSPLHKIASGGELSRFMLALKVVLAGIRSTPTMIFDEIDTGTGGQVADAIGKRLATLGKKSQVLVVTHLPQVAAFGSQHLFVSKASQKTKIKTQVTSLSHDQRHEELARMLAGEQVTKEARSAASKLLESAA